MSNVNIGDKVKVVNDSDIWCLDAGLPIDTILTVVEDDDDYDHYVNRHLNTIEIGAIKEWPNDFEKVQDKYFGGLMGDVVSELPNSITSIKNQSEGGWVLNKGGFTLTVPDQYVAGFGVGIEQPVNNNTLVSDDKVGEEFAKYISDQCGKILNKNVQNKDDMVDSFTQFRDQIKEAHESKESGILGVYRPNLEERKVGKVGMHMVIDGFPRALREVAKVMTWAADAKGYKLHDWRNLPEAETAFPAAEYRHQNDNSIMKAEGTPAIERTDHESDLLHAAHKIFNGLAELELILEGKIV